jgi:hypothetical protein
LPTIVEKNFTPIIREITNIINDFPTYKIETHFNFGQVTDWMTVSREKPVEPKVEKKKKHFWSLPDVDYDFKLCLSDSEKYLDKFEINLHESTWTNELKLSASLKVLPAYNKTLISALSKFLEENNFKVTVEINS